MAWTSIVAIYTLFWVLSCFLVMPFGMRTNEEVGKANIPGQVESAPADWRPGRVAIRAAVVAAVLFGLFYANYVHGWITKDMLNFFGNGPADYKDPDYLKSAP
jgi:predicted secreted protein